MKITFNKKILSDALARLLVAVTSKSASIVTEGILMEASEGNPTVTLSAFDLEKGVRMEIEAEISEGGRYIISAQKLSQIVRTMPGEEIELRVDDKNTVTILGGRSIFRLHALPGSDFPSMPMLSGEKGFIIGEKELGNLISRVLFAVANGDQRPALNGVYFEITGSKIRVIGCDGFKFAMCDRVCELENKDSDPTACYKFIVPGKTAAELVKMLSEEEGKITLELARKHIIFKIRDFIFFSRMIDHEYIDYERVIPREAKVSATVSNIELVSALERASLVTEDRAAGSVKSHVKFSFEENRLIVSSDSVNGSVKDELAIFHRGEDMEIGFNCKYLLDAFRACGADDIELRLNSPLMAMAFSPVNPDEDETFLFFVLPVRMKEQA